MASPVSSYTPKHSPLSNPAKMVNFARNRKNVVLPKINTLEAGECAKDEQY
jgi:hypothetical protein